MSSEVPLTASATLHNHNLTSWPNPTVAPVTGPHHPVATVPTAPTTVATAAAPPPPAPGSAVTIPQQGQPHHPIPNPNILATQCQPHHLNHAHLNHHHHHLPPPPMPIAIPPLAPCAGPPGHGPLVPHHLGPLHPLLTATVPATVVPGHPGSTVPRAVTGQAPPSAATMPLPTGTPLPVPQSYSNYQNLNLNYQNFYIPARPGDYVAPNGPSTQEENEEENLDNKESQIEPIAKSLKDEAGNNNITDATVTSSSQVRPGLQSQVQDAQIMSPRFLQHQIQQQNDGAKTELIKSEDVVETSKTPVANGHNDHTTVQQLEPGLGTTAATATTAPPHASMLTQQQKNELQYHQALVHQYYQQHLLDHYHQYHHQLQWMQSAYSEQWYRYYAQLGLDTAAIHASSAQYDPAAASAAVHAAAGQSQYDPAAAAQTYDPASVAQNQYDPQSVPAAASHVQASTTQQVHPQTVTNTTGTDTIGAASAAAASQTQAQQTELVHPQQLYHPYNQYYYPGPLPTPPLHHHHLNHHLVPGQQSLPTEAATVPGHVPEPITNTSTTVIDAHHDYQNQHVPGPPSVSLTPVADAAINTDSFFADKNIITRLISENRPPGIEDSVQAVNFNLDITPTVTNSEISCGPNMNRNSIVASGSGPPIEIKTLSQAIEHSKYPIWMLKDLFIKMKMNQETASATSIDSSGVEVLKYSLQLRSNKSPRLGYIQNKPERAGPGQYHHPHHHIPVPKSYSVNQDTTGISRYDHDYQYQNTTQSQSQNDSQIHHSIENQSHESQDLQNVTTQQAITTSSSTTKTDQIPIPNPNQNNLYGKMSEIMQKIQMKNQTQSQTQSNVTNAAAAVTPSTAVPSPLDVNGNEGPTKTLEERVREAQRVAAINNNSSSGLSGTGNNNLSGTGNSNINVNDNSISKGQGKSLDSQNRRNSMNQSTNNNFNLANDYANTSNNNNMSQYNQSKIDVQNQINRLIDETNMNLVNKNNLSNHQTFGPQSDMSISKQANSNDNSILSRPPGLDVDHHDVNQIHNDNQQYCWKNTNNIDTSKLPTAVAATLIAPSLVPGVNGNNYLNSILTQQNQNQQPAKKKKKKNKNSSSTIINQNQSQSQQTQQSQTDGSLKPAPRHPTIPHSLYRAMAAQQKASHDRELRNQTSYNLLNGIKDANGDKNLLCLNQDQNSMESLRESRLNKIISEQEGQSGSLTNDIMGSWGAMEEEILEDNKKKEEEQEKMKQKEKEEEDNNNLKGQTELSEGQGKEQQSSLTWAKKLKQFSSQQNKLDNHNNCNIDHDASESSDAEALKIIQKEQELLRNQDIDVKSYRESNSSGKKSETHKSSISSTSKSKYNSLSFVEKKKLNFEDSDSLSLYLQQVKSKKGSPEPMITTSKTQSNTLTNRTSSLITQSSISSATSTNSNSNHVTTRVSGSVTKSQSQSQTVTSKTTESKSSINSSTSDKKSNHTTLQTPKNPSPPSSNEKKSTISSSSTGGSSKGPLANSSSRRDKIYQPKAIVTSSVNTTTNLNSNSTNCTPQNLNLKKTTSTTTVSSSSQKGQGKKSRSKPTAGRFTKYMIEKSPIYREKK